MRYLPICLLLWVLLTAIPGQAADLEVTATSAIESPLIAEVVVPRLASDVITRWPTPDTLVAAGYEKDRSGEMIRVMLSILVSENGGIDRIGVFESNDPGGIYVQAAMKSIQSASFHPGREGSSPRRMWTLVCIDFPPI